MSAHAYKVRLADVTRRLGESARAAEEWKRVADHRLKYLVYLDHAMNSMVMEMVKLGKIFSAEPAGPLPLIADANSHSANEVSDMICLKLSAMSSFCALLAREAICVRGALDETLELAVKALEVERPTLDLAYTDTNLTGLSPAEAVIETLDDHDIQTSPEIERALSLPSGGSIAPRSRRVLSLFE